MYLVSPDLGMMETKHYDNMAALVRNAQAYITLSKKPDWLMRLNFCICLDVVVCPD